MTDNTIPTEQQRIQDLKEIEKRVELMSSGFLDQEIHTLAELSKLTESIEKMLAKHYENTFPKTCHNCGEIYESLSDYQNKTQLASSGKSSVFNKFGVQEFRNCACGSTLVLISGDRRDQSEYGEARRQLFDRCFAKIREHSSETDDEIREFLRHLFRTGQLPKNVKRASNS